MPQKPKARGGASQTKGKSSGAGAAQKTQSERFVEAARAVGVDETGREFDLALSRIMPPKIAASSKARKDRAKSS